MSTKVIEVQELHKTYTTFKKKAGLGGALTSFFSREVVPVQAIKPTSFAINKGEFVGLLGPNGAGKTTMLKMMTGLIPPTGGTCLAFGQYNTSKRPQAYLRRIGMVMGQRNQLHPDLPAIDSFRLSKAIYNVSEERFKSRIEACLSLFDISHKVNIPVRKLSLGERMKMELILAILHEPELLFLDEPTIGLDFNAAKQIRKFLADANKAFGITIVLTSHYTKDIEELCRRVILVNYGTTIYDGPLAGLDDRIQGERQFTVRLTDLQQAAKLDLWAQENSEIKNICRDPEDACEFSFSVTSRHAPEIANRLLSLLQPETIRDLIITERSLEDVFGEIYSRSTNVTT